MAAGEGEDTALIRKYFRVSNIQGFRTLPRTAPLKTAEGRWHRGNRQTPPCHFLSSSDRDSVASSKRCASRQPPGMITRGDHIMHHPNEDTCKNKKGALLLITGIQYQGPGQTRASDPRMNLPVSGSGLSTGLPELTH